MLLEQLAEFSHLLQTVEIKRFRYEGWNLHVWSPQKESNPK